MTSNRLGARASQSIHDFLIDAQLKKRTHSNQADRLIARVPYARPLMNKRERKMRTTTKIQITPNQIQLNGHNNEN